MIQDIKYICNYYSVYNVICDYGALNRAYFGIKIRWFTPPIFNLSILPIGNVIWFQKEYMPSWTYVTNSSLLDLFI